MTRALAVATERLANADFEAFRGAWMHLEKTYPQGDKLYTLTQKEASWASGGMEIKYKYC